MYRNAISLTAPEKKYDESTKSDVNKSIYPGTPITGQALDSLQYKESHLCKSLALNNEKSANKIPHENNYPQLTIQMFFDFMKTAYQLNDKTDGLMNILAQNSEINWSELAKINLNVQSANSKNVGTDEIDNEIKQLVPLKELCESEQDKDPKKEVTDNTNANKSLDLQLTSKKLKNSKCETATEEVQEHPLSKLMNKSLSDILHEGLLDSVLPYILPKAAVSQPVIKKSMMSLDIKKASSLNSNVDKSAITSSGNKEKEKDKSKVPRKSLEAEVEIHVCDEAKNIKKDFRCPQKLLIQKMCYFADVTAGQKLEEMDISVHCDIVIFDWLMRWVKKDIIKKSEWPILEASNVIPITVSASFLQMEPLLDQCLVFCHENMSEILKTSTILTCLNDNIFTRLANLYSNLDVEILKDKKDKVQSRLFCKLILALADPIPDNNRGHYSSLANLFKCSKCGKHIISAVADHVSCLPSTMKIDSKGNIYNKHTRDPTWNLNDYIVSLRSELRYWRKVYWRLWADCHFLYCIQCHTYFPINQMDWCSYHPEIPQFFANEQQRSASLPIGRYPCCSQHTYRFESLPNHEGCQFKEHIASISEVNDGHILNIFTLYRDVISLDPPQRFFPEKITRLITRDPCLQSGRLLCKEAMWWDGIELSPPRAKLGLLAKIWGGSVIRKPCQPNEGSKALRKWRPQSSQVVDVVSPTTSTSDSEEDDGVTCGDSSIDAESDNSEESHSRQLYKPTGKVKQRYNSTSKRNDGARCWNMNLLVKYNQDNQRDFEERATTQMITLLTKRTSAEPSIMTKMYKNSYGWNSQPLGGTYISIEAEFKEQSANIKTKNTNTKGPSRARSSKPQ